VFSAINHNTCLASHFESNFWYINPLDIRPVFAEVLGTPLLGLITHRWNFKNV